MGKHLPGRPSPRDRGYGPAHIAKRKALEPRVNAGLADCTAQTCLVEKAGGTRRIAPGTPWDLGHDENDRTKYAGPQHAACNRGASRRAPVRTVPPLDPSAPFDEGAWD